MALRAGPHAKLLSSIPQDWLDFIKTVMVHVDGKVRSLAFEGMYMPGKWRHQMMLTTSSGSDIGRRLIEHENARSKFYTERNSAKKQLHAVLQSFSSKLALLKAWPDLKPFIAMNDPELKGNLPATTIQHLNVLLGLPIKEDE